VESEVIREVFSDTEKYGIDNKIKDIQKRKTNNNDFNNFLVEFEHRESKKKQHFYES
jgi:hypothetical protein